VVQIQSISAAAAYTANSTGSTALMISTLAAQQIEERSTLLAHLGGEIPYARRELGVATQLRNPVCGSVVTAPLRSTTAKPPPCEAQGTFFAMPLRSSSIPSALLPRSLPTNLNLTSPYFLEGGQIFVKGPTQMPHELKKTDVSTNAGVISNTHDLRAFCRKLDLGEHPDFLQVMAALEAASAYGSSFNRTATPAEEKYFSMSQNKCRFCD